MSRKAEKESVVPKVGTSGQSSSRPETKKEKVYKTPANTTTMLNINDVATFCKKKGFVYPSSEIYGGFSGFWDYGPLGVELFNNLKAHWWKHFVH